MIDEFHLKTVLSFYLKEDIGVGDITSCNLPGSEKKVVSRIVAREGCVVSGTRVIPHLFSLLGKDTEVKVFVRDGDIVKEGTAILEIRGPALTILKGERVALNILQRLSGISTLTRRMVKKLEGTKTKLSDTRKTTPGMRLLEKYAVRVGGGVNHRMGLFDAVIVKDNHIKVAGSIKKAVEKIRKSVPFTCKVEVEAKTLQQVEEALMSGADIIMLDNMDLDSLRKAVSIIGKRAIKEASGNVTPDNIRDVAETGVDYISSGFITHHAVWIDMSMDVTEILN